MSGENDNENFDIDSGVSDLADRLGFSSGYDGEEGSDDSFAEESEDVSELDGSEDGAGEDEVEDEEEVAEETDEPPAAEAKAPPASWAKEKHETWGKLPPDAQEYIELREKQMLDGIEQYKAGNQYSQYFFESIAPYKSVIDLAGGDPVAVIQNLFQHHQALTTGSLQDRQKAFMEIGYRSGLIPQQGQTQQDLERIALERQIQEQKQLTEAQQIAAQRQQYNALMSELERMAKSAEYAYFDDVAEDMIPWLQAGHDAKTAYEKAVWANPVTRAKQQAATIPQQPTQKQQQEVKTAKKATSVNVKPATKTARASSESAPKGSMRDTMMETLQKIKNR